MEETIKVLIEEKNGEMLEIFKKGSKKYVRYICENG